MIYPELLWEKYVKPCFFRRMLKKLQAVPQENDCCQECSTKIIVVTVPERNITLWFLQN
jgi:hypothetical protein